MFEVLKLVALSLQLVAVKNEAELQYRIDIANAVISVTDSEHEQRVLVSIVRYETSFISRLGAPNCTCLRNECDNGRAFGAWQIIPRSKREREELCVSLEGDAKLALFRIRESERACWKLPPNERLAIYTRGSCFSEEGKRLSKIRWIQ